MSTIYKDFGTDSLEQVDLLDLTLLTCHGMNDFVRTLLGILLMWMFNLDHGFVNKGMVV